MAACFVQRAVWNVVLMWSPHARKKKPDMPDKFSPRQHRALAMIRAGKTTREIAAATGYREYSVYRLAQSHGLEASRGERQHVATPAGTLLVRGRLKAALDARIPSGAIHAAGFHRDQRLRFLAEPGRIVVTRDS